MLFWHFINLLRIFMRPFYPILKILRFFNARYIFEQENLRDLGARSFYKDKLRAKICFHFSSEGEFEQVKFLLHQLVEKNELIELLFTSPSVEPKVIKFYKSYPNNVRYLRLPLLSFFPFVFGQNINHWVSAKTLMMVRYDFFPELMTLGSRLERFVLFSASVKSSSKNLLATFIKDAIFNTFSDIYPATNKDRDYFVNKLGHVHVHCPLELRCLEIESRLKRFKSNPFSDSFTRFFDNLKAKRSICIAQAWPVEMSIFNLHKFINDITSGETFVYVAPHMLTAQFSELIKDSIVDKGLIIYTIEKNASVEDVNEILSAWSKKPGIIISSLPNLLCELYSFFDAAFVGGGHGKGVHSLLEPYIAKTKIFCGPNVFRSTEYDLIISNNIPVTIIDNLETLYDNVKNCTDEQVYDISKFCDQNRLAVTDLMKEITK